MLSVDIVEGPEKVMDRKVDVEDVKIYAKRIGVDTNNIFETSAKYGKNVNEVFQYASTFYEKAPTDPSQLPPPGIQVPQNNDNTKGCC